MCCDVCDGLLECDVGIEVDCLFDVCEIGESCGWIFETGSEGVMVWDGFDG